MSAATAVGTSRPGRRMRSGHGIPHGSVFVLAALSFCYVPALGRVYVSEVMLGGYVVWCLMRRRHFPPWIRWVLAFGALWILCQLASDVYNNIGTGPRLKAVANILVLVLDLAGLSLLFERGNNLRTTGMAVAAGLFVASLGAVAVQPDIYIRMDPWKFALAFPMSLLLGAASLRLGKAAAIPMLVLSVTHFALNFRSLGGICLLSAVITLLAGSPSRSTESTRRRTRAISVVIASVVAVAGAGSAYEVAVRRGWLGEIAAYKHSYQAQGRYGVLAGGRSDIYFSSLAVQRRPLIGYGSEPRLTTDLMLHGLGRMHADGYYLPSVAVDDIIRSKTIPTHSFVMGAWVQAGIGGLMFWLGILWLVARIFMRLASQGMVTNGFVAVALASVIWNILFSPLGGSSRLTFAVTFGMLAWAAMSLPNDGRPWDERLARIDIEDVAHE